MVLICRAQFNFNIKWKRSKRSNVPKWKHSKGNIYNYMLSIILAQWCNVSVVAFFYRKVSFHKCTACNATHFNWQFMFYHLHNTFLYLLWFSCKFNRLTLQKKKSFHCKRAWKINNKYSLNHRRTNNSTIILTFSRYICKFYYCSFFLHFTQTYLNFV